VALSVQHDRDPLAVRLSDGSVRNAYTMKLLNKSTSPQHYTLGVEGLDATMTIVGNGSADSLRHLRCRNVGVSCERR
jgi:polyferredoxin